MRTLQENINQVNSDFNAIKAKIIESGVEVAEGTKTEEYAAKVGKVYEAGKKAEYDKYWENYQTNGDRVNYYAAFCGPGWTIDNFKPKYDIQPTSCGIMFYMSTIRGDLVEILDSCGVTLDTSKSTNLASAFANTFLTRVGVINATNATALNQLFYTSSYLQTVEKLILKSDGTNTFSGNAFHYCTALTNITIEGVIGQDGFAVQHSTKLSKESITSIINALSTTTSGLTLRLSKTAKEAAFTEDEWNELRATKTNWAITLE